MNRFAILLIAALAATGPVAAHHGFRMAYESKTAYWIEGEILDGYYGMPHAEFDLRIAKGAMPPPGFAPADAGDLMPILEPAPGNLHRTVEIEFPQQQQFYALGDVLSPGDRVAVIALRGCESPFPLRAQWIRLPDGSTLRAKGTVQKEVKTCGPTYRDN